MTMKLSALGLFSTAAVLLATQVPSVMAINCATDIISCTQESGFKTYKYGPSYVTSDNYENQVGDLYLPTNAVWNPIPVVVLIHGGYCKHFPVIV